MKKFGLIAIAATVVTMVVATAGSAKSQYTVLNGSGSTFVQPLVSVWTPAVGSAFDYTIQYAGVGSGGGITAVSNRSVDFGASDAPLTPTQASGCNGCVQIPWALGAVSIPYNVPGTGVAHLRFTGPVLAKIYLGTISNWNDPAIKALNPKAKLPNLAITPVYRSDSSGTTYAFADYLTRVNAQWKSTIGYATLVSFPKGVGAKGSSGVAGVVSNTPGAITYVDIAYALNNHLNFGAVANGAGKFVYPSIKNIVAAGASVQKVPASNALHITHPSRKYPAAYPICTFTYVILPIQTPKAAELRKFVYWALTQGQTKQYTGKLVFAPIPLKVLSASEKTLKQIHS